MAESNINKLNGAASGENPKSDTSGFPGIVPLNSQFVSSINSQNEMESSSPSLLSSNEFASSFASTYDKIAPGIIHLPYATVEIGNTFINKVNYQENDCELPPTPKIPHLEPHSPESNFNLNNTVKEEKYQERNTVLCPNAVNKNDVNINFANKLSFLHSSVPEKSAEKTKSPFVNLGDTCKNLLNTSSVKKRDKKSLLGENLEKNPINEFIKDINTEKKLHCELTTTIHPNKNNSGNEKNTGAQVLSKELLMKNVRRNIVKTLDSVKKSMASGITSTEYSNINDMSSQIKNPSSNLHTADINIENVKEKYLPKTCSENKSDSSDDKSTDDCSKPGEISKSVKKRKKTKHETPIKREKLSESSDFSEGTLSDVVNLEDIDRLPGRSSFKKSNAFGVKRKRGRPPYRSSSVTSCHNRNDVLQRNESEQQEHKSFEQDGCNSLGQINVFNSSTDFPNNAKKNSDGLPTSSNTARKSITSSVSHKARKSMKCSAKPSNYAENQNVKCCPIIKKKTARKSTRSVKHQFFDIFEEKSNSEISKNIQVSSAFSLSTVEALTLNAVNDITVELPYTEDFSANCSKTNNTFVDTNSFSLSAANSLPEETADVKVTPYLHYPLADEEFDAFYITAPFEGVGFIKLFVKDLYVERNMLPIVLVRNAFDDILKKTTSFYQFRDYK